MTPLDMADRLDADDTHLFPLASLILARNGLEYPAVTGADPAYVARLQVPGGAAMDYGDIFDRAVARTAEAWEVIAAGVQGDEGYRSWFGDWNLDTGCDGEGRLVFWE